MYHLWQFSMMTDRLKVDKRQVFAVVQWFSNWARKALGTRSISIQVLKQMSKWKFICIQKTNYPLYWPLKVQLHQSDNAAFVPSVKLTLGCDGTVVNTVNYCPAQYLQVVQDDIIFLAVVNDCLFQTFWCPTWCSAMSQIILSRFLDQWDMLFYHNFSLVFHWPPSFCLFVHQSTKKLFQLLSTSHSLSSYRAIAWSCSCQSLSSDLHYKLVQRPQGQLKL